MAEWNAEEYNRQSTLQQTMAAEVLALLHLKGTERVLDVGCGDGKITAEIAARLPQGSVVGIDPSRSMIDFASNHFASTNSHLQFQVADARDMPFQEEFDLVVSFNALHWIPDQDAALLSIHRALKPQGTVQLRLVATGERKSLENVIEETRQSPRWAQYFSNFRDPYLHLTPEQYAAAAERNRFCVTSMHMESKAWDFGSRAAFFAFGTATFTEWTRLLPEAEKPAFINNVLDRYGQEVVNQPGEENTFEFYQLNITLSRA
ncbi:MAG: class I SAM-dependent methyltransferase [Acidobacteriaceae bacterium]|nr:class I SAM-dependent methyltransferase [Acidobacteriaceae bacterium]